MTSTGCLPPARGCTFTGAFELPSTAGLSDGSFRVCTIAAGDPVACPQSPAVLNVTPPPREIVTVQPAPPPPPPTETRTVSPAADYTWISGAYEWSNGTWQWSPGHWVKPAQPYAT